MRSAQFYGAATPEGPANAGRLDRRGGRSHDAGSIAARRKGSSHPSPFTLTGITSRMVPWRSLIACALGAATSSPRGASPKPGAFRPSSSSPSTPSAIDFWIAIRCSTSAECPRAFARPVSSTVSVEDLSESLLDGDRPHAGPAWASRSTPSSTLFARRPLLRTSANDGTWFGGEPIWVTAERAARTATYFWNRVARLRSRAFKTNYWHPFDATVPGAREGRRDHALAPPARGARPISS